MGEQISKEVIQALGNFPIAVLSDALNKKCPSANMRPEIKPVFRKARLCGPAVTVQSPIADNLTFHKAISTAKPGDVIVVNAGGYKKAGLFGEIMALACQVKGIAGVVIDGACRDVADIEEMGFPVFAAAVNPGGTVKETLGEINVPIQCGETPVNPGDIIVGDLDGVIVIPRERAKETLLQAQSISEKEARFMTELKKGRSNMEVLGFNELLKRKGLE